MVAHQNVRHCNIETLKLGTAIGAHTNKRIYHTILKRKFHIHISERHTHQHTHTHERRHEQLPSAMTDYSWRSWWQTMLLVLLWKIGGILLAVCHSHRVAIGMCAVRYTCVRPRESVRDMQPIVEIAAMCEERIVSWTAHWPFFGNVEIPGRVDDHHFITFSLSLLQKFSSWR
jgi:hypothetical protein